MSDQMFDIYRKASESWLKMQQELFQQGAPSSLLAAPKGAVAAPEWVRNAQKRWIELTAEVLTRQRESVDGLYKSAIHLVQQTSQVAEATPSQDARKSSGANGSKETKATPKPDSVKSRHSRKATGRRPERPSPRNR